jgi:CBS domain-containing protein
LLNETGSTRTISKLVSLYNDAITNQIIQIALKETGMAPVPFSFITIGSSGREEFAFNSDQDNAIIFRESETIPTEDLQNYFLKLGEKICNYLDESGLVYCKGSYMAQNKKWCQPLHVWEEYFAEWIVNSDATNILNISVFFDLRHSYGDKELFNELENYIFEIMKGRSTFFFNLAQSIAGFKPPLNVFGNIITESSGKNTETLDIKNCLSPVIMFVRIYSLYNNIRKLGTLERISDLQRLEILSPSTIEELQFQFNYLLQLRLKHQLDQIGMNMEPDNLISPKKLTEIEQIILKKIFSQMNNYQAKLSAGFMSSYKN